MIGYPDITVIINFHNEGRLAKFAIKSAKIACDRASAHGIATEIVCVLDRPDTATREVVTGLIEDKGIVLSTAGDLAEARNAGVSRSSGSYVAFLDGDDLWGDMWLVNGYRLLETLKSESVVVHPKVSMYFSHSEMKPYYWFHPDMRYDDFSLRELNLENPWTALVMARRDLFVRFPYERNQIATGFGYEDWSWNYRTVSNGILHVTADQTIHFIRRKVSGSLLSSTNTARAIPYLSKNRRPF
ncbi:glycosyltransferase [Methylobacterium brachiatum]|uniref:Glycosyltransferase n=1 Tax=Methylobacterium brachiatum TaxID=269660 RepID=A0ABV1R747_9HYPH